MMNLYIYTVIVDNRVMLVHSLEECDTDALRQLDFMRSTMPDAFVMLQQIAGTDLIEMAKKVKEYYEKVDAQVYFDAQYRGGFSNN